jgi:hypothetical protein
MPTYGTGFIRAYEDGEVVQNRVRLRLCEAGRSEDRRTNEPDHRSQVGIENLSCTLLWIGFLNQDFHFRTVWW